LPTVTGAAATIVYILLCYLVLSAFSLKSIFVPFMLATGAQRSPLLPVVGAMGWLICNNMPFSSTIIRFSP
jgi:hypothetical protein